MSRKMVSSWNKVVKLLIALQKAWEDHRKQMMTLPDLSEMDAKAQEFLSLSLNRSPFRIVLPEFIRLMIGKGSLEELIVPQRGEDKQNATTT